MNEDDPFRIRCQAGCLSIRRSPSELLQERLLCKHPLTGSPDYELLARRLSYQRYLSGFNGSSTDAGDADV